MMNVKEKPPKVSEAPVSDTRVIGTSTFTLAHSIGERIKWARERRDMTQKELGKQIGKSRASIVQYEQGNIAAPIEVISELARALMVGPEYLAFGRSGVPGIKNAEEEVQTVSELTESGTTLVPTGGWAIPRDMFSDFSNKLRVVNLKSDEPHLDLKRSDRIVIDKTNQFVKDGQYLVSGKYGHRVVKLSGGMTTGNTLRMTSGFDGTDVTIATEDLKIAGMVVGIFRQTY